MELTTKRLTLREFEPDDWQLITDYMADPEVRQYLLKNQWTENYVRRLVNGSIKWAKRQPRLYYGFAISLRNEGSLIGSCSLSFSQAQARVGWDLNRRYWNQGYATEAAHALLAFAFDTLGVSRVEAACFSANSASVRVLEKIGMQTKMSRLQNWWRTVWYFEKLPIICFSLSASEWKYLTMKIEHD